jgi:hypothetical protein
MSDTSNQPIERGQESPDERKQRAEREFMQGGAAPAIATPYGAAFTDVLPGRETHTPEEVEASAILDRVERDLPAVEQRTERLMHRYGL